MNNQHAENNGERNHKSNERKDHLEKGKDRAHTSIIILNTKFETKMKTS